MPGPSSNAIKRSHPGNVENAPSLSISAMLMRQSKSPPSGLLADAASYWQRSGRRWERKA